jgi:hypothetical protein
MIPTRACGVARALSCWPLKGSRSCASHISCRLLRPGFGPGGRSSWRGGGPDWSTLPAEGVPPRWARPPGRSWRRPAPRRLRTMGFCVPSGASATSVPSWLTTTGRGSPRRRCPAPFWPRAIASAGHGMTSDTGKSRRPWRQLGKCWTGPKKTPPRFRWGSTGLCGRRRSPPPSPAGTNVAKAGPAGESAGRRS